MKAFSSETLYVASGRCLHKLAEDCDLNIYGRVLSMLTDWVDNLFCKGDQQGLGWPTLFGLDVANSILPSEIDVAS